MALTLMRELVGLGHEVLPLDWQHNQLAHEAAGSCLVLPPPPLARTALWHFSLLRRVRRLDLQHDVLLNTTGYPNVLGRHPALAMVVHDLHMLQPGFYRRFKRSWFRIFYRRGLQQARLLVCVSEHTRQLLLQRYPLDPKRCVVVPNALDPSFVAQAAETCSAAGEAGTDPYFLAVGTIEERKNVHRLVEAFLNCRSQGLAMRLVLAGRPGHGSTQLMKRLQHPDLRDAVEVRRGVDDRELQQLYRGARALLFPSLEEGFGLPILEAMQCGTPVLTSLDTATAEVAGDAALLVPPTDLAALQSGILQLGQDDDICARLRQRGHERVQEFTSRRQAEAYARHLSATCLSEKSLSETRLSETSEAETYVADTSSGEASSADASEPAAATSDDVSR